ncbi:MAG: hypothetical protein R8L07_12355 [Alphaproteobacteria bacterium]|nr:hypothetical protein [Alphaproteobacteria bacterium]
MAYHYLIPLVFSKPVGYEMSLAVPGALIAKRLAERSARVQVEVRATIDGSLVFEEVRQIDFSDPAAAAGVEEFSIPAKSDADDGLQPGFIEVEILNPDGKAVFSTKAPPELYGLYFREGRQSFRADGSYKFGAPSVIASVAENKAFVESYPVICIDLERGCLESLSLVNPYTRALLVSGKTADGREFKRTRVAARSAVKLDLTKLLRPGETRLDTRLQITATNRVLTYHVRHDGLSVPYISDHEHLDIFRSDPTHTPLSLYLRERFARTLKRRYGIRISE